jgi:putative membrane protein
LLQEEVGVSEAVASQGQDRAAQVMKSLSDLALVRTAFSSGRSLMSWIRTSVSLYGFGFSISKFIDYLELQQQGTHFSTGLRRLGIALICMGVVALALAMAEHWQRVRRMRALGLPPESPVLLPVAAAGVLIGIGLATLITLTTGWPS